MERHILVIATIRDGDSTEVRLAAGRDWVRAKIAAGFGEKAQNVRYVEGVYRGPEHIGRSYSDWSYAWVRCAFNTA